jgi:hypothetical protein
MGLEETPEAYIQGMVEVFREVWRVLRKDGTAWVNLGDSYASDTKGSGGGWAADPKNYANQAQAYGARKFKQSLKSKDLMMMPARVALALQADGWWLRSMMPWVKRSAMPESVTDRPATAIEYVFLFAKSQRYFFDMEAVRQDSAPPTGGRQRAALKGDDKYVGQVGGEYHEGRPGRHSAYQPPNRNFRNSDLFYTSLEPPHGLISGQDGPLALDVNPAGFAEAHFATFPPKLVDPCIKAGTSERGACAECGAPWVREVEKEFQQTGPARDNTTGQDNMEGWEGWPRGTTESKTLGWSPSCACKAKPVPCTVLDPFGGAGTTALVADRLGRDAILMELNDDYASMARARIEKDAGLFAEVGHETRP